jgi:transcriptional regulator with XRE-family HTH domain
MIIQKVKQTAEKKNINQSQLSRLSNVGYTTIRRMFDDETYTPSFDVLQKIADALEVAPLDLVEDVPDNFHEKL